MLVACTGDICEQQRTESVIANLPVYWRWYHSDLKQTQMDRLIKPSHTVKLSNIFDYDTHSPDVQRRRWRIIIGGFT